MREGRFRAKTADVFTSGDEQSSGMLRAEPEALEGRRSFDGDELIKVAVEFSDLLSEQLDALGQAPQRDSRRSSRTYACGGRAHPAAQCGLRLQSLSDGEPFADVCGSRDHEVAELTEGSRTRLHRAVPSDSQLADRFDDPG